MKDPTLAIELLGRIGDKVPFQTVRGEAALGALDLKIIGSLHHDCRKSSAKVAKEVGSSAKTVQKHINKMIKEGLIEMWVLGDPAVIRYATAAIHVHIREGVDLAALGMEMVRRFPNEVYAFRRYLNLPNLLSLASCHANRFRPEQIGRRTRAGRSHQQSRPQCGGERGVVRYMEGQNAAHFGIARL